MKIDLLNSVIHQLKFGYMEEQKQNIDLIVFSDPRYFDRAIFPEHEKSFLTFEINNN